MHLFLLIVLHTFAEFIHHVYLVFGLFSEHERQQRPFLAFEMLSFFFPLLVNWNYFALINKISKNPNQKI